MSSDSGGPSSPPPQATYPHVAMWGAAGALVLGVTLTFAAPWPAHRMGEWWTLPLLLAASAVLSNVTVRMPVGRGAESDQSISEAALLPAVVLLHPGWAVLVAVVGELVAEIAVRKHPVKVVFNVGWTAVAAGGAAVSYDALAGAGMDTPRTIVAGLVAASVYLAINLVALYGVAAAVTGRSIRSLLESLIAGQLQVSFGAASIGLLAAVIVVEAPWFLPLLAVPLLLSRSRSAMRQRYELEIIEERDRFDRTIAKASDAIVLVGPAGNVRVWNAAAEATTGRDAADAVGRPVVELLELIDLHGRRLDLAEVLTTARNSVGHDEFAAIAPMTGRTLAVRVAADHSGDEVVLVMRDVSTQHELDRMREDLVSRVSHELRTPLATSAGFLETVLGRWDALNEEQRRELVEVAHRASRRLNRVVAGLLVRSRIEGGATAPRPERVCLESTVEEVIAELRGAISLPVGVVRSDPGVAAWVDRDHLQQVIENLVVNADRYGEVRIEVTVLDLDGSVALEVRDHGPGIDPDFVPELFESFTQASVGLRRTAEGLGLGLSIVRALVEANGGTICYDDAPGGGAQFTVRLPSADVHAGNGQDARSTHDRAEVGARA